MIQQLDVEPRQPAGDGSANASQADDAHRAVVEVGADPTQRIPGDPLPGDDVVGGGDQAPGCCQHQGQRQVGSCLGENAWRVPDGHPVRCTPPGRYCPPQRPSG